jgi:hypothetical protein
MEVFGEYFGPSFISTMTFTAFGNQLIAKILAGCTADYPILPQFSVNASNAVRHTDLKYANACYQKRRRRGKVLSWCQ